MLVSDELSIGNYINYNGAIVQVSSLDKKTVGLFHPLHPETEIRRPYSSMDIFGVRLFNGFLKDVLHFVKYESPFGPMDDNEELTDGRIVLRNIKPSENYSCYIPSNFPWAANRTQDMEFVTQICELHQLQNLYFNIFRQQLDITIPTNLF